MKLYKGEVHKGDIGWVVKFKSRQLGQAMDIGPESKPMPRILELPVYDDVLLVHCKPGTKCKFGIVPIHHDHTPNGIEEFAVIYEIENLLLKD